MLFIYVFVTYWLNNSTAIPPPLLTLRRRCIILSPSSPLFSLIHWVFILLTRKMRPSFMIMFLTSSRRLISPSNWPHRSCSTSRVLNRPRVDPSAVHHRQVLSGRTCGTASPGINTGLTVSLTVDTIRQATSFEIKSVKGYPGDLC